MELRNQRSTSNEAGVAALKMIDHWSASEKKHAKTRIGYGGYYIYAN
jgi:hypothetical protein